MTFAWDAFVSSLLREQQLTRQNLIRKCNGGVNGNTVRGLLSEGKTPSVAKLERMLDALGYDLLPVKREGKRS